MNTNHWKLICQNVQSHRVATGCNKDLYLNPIIKDIYLRESAFACNVLKVNYLRTKNSKYKEDCELTVQAISNRLRIYGLEGIREPVIGTRFCRMKNGSLPASIILIHALDQAIGISNVNKQINVEVVSSLVSNCQVGKGSYTHDAISSSNKAPIVLNTSAMVCYFHSRVQGQNNENSLADGVMFLVKNQRSDGLWPYCNINGLDKLIWRYQKYMGGKCTKVYDYLRQDRSIFFGDYLHHVVTLYYMVCALENRPKYLVELRPAILKALDFIENNSIIRGGKAYLNYQWEPNLKSIRHCNFRDSSAYFYLAAALVKLEKIDRGLTSKVPQVQSYINYVFGNLWNAADGNFYPYDSNDIDLLNKIMQRPAESIFDKAFLYSVAVGSM